MSPIEPPLWLTGLLCIWFGMVVIFIMYLLHHLWTGRDAADLDEAFQPLDDLHLSLLHDLPRYPTPRADRAAALDPLTPRNPMSTRNPMIPPGYWRNAAGHLVPEERVELLDQERDALVRAIAHTPATSRRSCVHTNARRSPTSIRSWNGRRQIRRDARRRQGQRIAPALV